MSEKNRKGPKPGDIYREYYAVTGQQWFEWAVIDTQVTHPGAGQYLPNGVYNIAIDDLQGAVRAEALIDRWGGHVGTSEKKIRFNGKEWIDLPELTTTPEGHRPECYMSQDNPIIDIPLDMLKEGDNTFEGSSGPQVCHSFGWGQWGLYSLVLRVYYGEDKPHPKGGIITPSAGDTLPGNPMVEAAAEGKGGIEQVDFLGYYEGYDKNGDGNYSDWHHFYHRPDGTEPEVPVSEHIGSADKAPFRVLWNTQWVPDQEPGSVKLLARIKDKSGMWYVTNPVENLSLGRSNYSVKLHKPSEVPESFQVRMKRTASCVINIPDTIDLKTAEEAVIHFRTWNGNDNLPKRDGDAWFKLNDWKGKIAGKDHDYAYSIREVPLKALKNGDNILTIYSEAGTVKDKDGNLQNTHSIEMLWPGPALTVRYKI